MKKRIAKKIIKIINEKRLQGKLPAEMTRKEITAIAVIKKDNRLEDIVDSHKRIIRKCEISNILRNK